MKPPVFYLIKLNQVTIELEKKRKKHDCVGLRLWFALNLLEKEVEMFGIIEQKSIRTWSRLTVCLGIVEISKKLYNTVYAYKC